MVEMMVIPEQSGSPALLEIGTNFQRDLSCPMVEMMGFEPMTPCLQGRCSPS